MNNPMQIIQKFNEFKNSYRGNPQEDIQKLISSGRLSQSQLNQLQAQARELQSLLKIVK